jgi:molybdopterin converting factor small subunit
MQVEIKLFGNLGHYLPQGGNRFALTKTLKGEMTALEMLRELNIPEKLPVMVIVNNRRVDRNYVLRDGDAMHCFLPSGGG